MDMRIEKTRRSIINAFLQLRAKKPLEKITVKELSALAEINKATFYCIIRIFMISRKLWSVKLFSPLSAAFSGLRISSPISAASSVSSEMPLSPTKDL
ncbi:MAG: TetR/AcrR family transcriptional regulator [Ruminococcus sp.]|nr:TetR/AcrR family transcriptional regulator [Ruminococcus sp.]